jgi:hydroxymethylpyrimidine pyrophosphatase-like HAD family hydrolase
MSSNNHVNRIKMIAMDIDGTLVDVGSRVSEENSRAIAEAAARGIEIVLVTGRRFQFARSVADQVPCDLCMINNNGAVVKSKTGESRLTHLLDAGVARRVLEATTEFRHSAAVFFDHPGQRQVIVERIDLDDPFRGPYLRRNVDFVSAVDPLTDCLVVNGGNGGGPVENPIHVGFVGGCRQMRAAKAILESVPFASEFTLASTEYESRDFAFLDVLRRGVTKGATLAEWAAHRGIAREEVMAIGDNWNDREMLEFAGLPVVMGNAIPELKALGWPVTLSNVQNGVAEAIRVYAFGETTAGLRG